MSAAGTIEWGSGTWIAGPALGYVGVREEGDEHFPTGGGWLSLDGLGYHPAMPNIDGSSNVTPGEDGHTLYYDFSDDSFRYYVRARIDESKSIIIPPGGSTFDRVGDYLFEGYEGFQYYYRHNVETGESLLIDIDPPPGWTMPTMPDWGTGKADSKGTAMYFVLSSGDTRQLWVYDIVEKTWEPLGKPFLSCGADEFIYIERLSHDIVLVGSGCYSYTLNLIRRDPPLSLIKSSNYWADPRIDSGQQCAALMGDDGWEVWTLDGTNEVFHTGHYGSFVWLD
jgi:hypothetical protein